MQECKDESIMVKDCSHIHMQRVATFYYSVCVHAAVSARVFCAFLLLLFFYLTSISKLLCFYYEVVTQNITRPNCCDKWEAKLNKDINWCSTFKKMQQIQEIKLKWFQIRLVHRIIAPNVVLMHMGIENDITCSFCRQDRDSINHIFWSCTYVRSFWEQFQMLAVQMRPQLHLMKILY